MIQLFCKIVFIFKKKSWYWFEKKIFLVLLPESWVLSWSWKHCAGLGLEKNTNDSKNQEETVALNSSFVRVWTLLVKVNIEGRLFGEKLVEPDENVWHMHAISLR